MFKKKKNKQVEEESNIPQEVEEECSTDLVDGKVMLASIDLNKNITYVNKAFRDALGYDKGELIGKSFEETLHPDMPMCLCKRAFEVASDGNPEKPSIWEGWVKSYNKDKSKCFWNTVFLEGVYTNNELSGFSVLKRGATQDKVDQVSEMYKDIIETGKSNNFCGNIEM